MDEIQLADVASRMPKYAMWMVHHYVYLCQMQDVHGLELWNTALTPGGYLWWRWSLKHIAVASGFVSWDARPICSAAQIAFDHRQDCLNLEII